MVELNRPAMLRHLLEYIFLCRCHPESRSLDVTVSPDAQGGPIEVDAHSSDHVTREMEKMAKHGLDRDQVLRKLLLRAARCTCRDKRL